MMNLAVPHRTNPRRRTILRLESGKHEREKVLNLSQTGMFIQGTDLADASRGVIWIPGDEKPLELKFRATFPRNGGTGVLFDPQDRHTRQELQAYVTHQREQERLQRMEQRLNDGKPANLKPMSEEVGTRNVLRPLEKSGSAIGVYRKIDGVALGARIAAVDPLNARMSLLLDSPNRAGQEIPQEFDEVFLALKQGDVTYLADTVVERTSGVLSSIMLPERVFLPERRVLEREASAHAVLRVELEGRTRIAQIEQLDANGFSALIDVADAPAFAKARELTGARLIRAAGETPIASLRVAWNAQVAEEGKVRFGFTRPHQRTPVQSEEVQIAQSRKTLLHRTIFGIQHYIGGFLGRVGVGPRVPNVSVKEFRDEAGRPIVALANATFNPDGPVPPGRVHLVLLPPPFARRKETLASVALVIVETFKAAGEHVAVFRYDGLNHLGESWRDEVSRAPDMAMLHWKLSQTVTDLRTVHQAAAVWLGQSLGRTAIISFSMAAVAARRYLADGAVGVDYWLAPMGAPDARDIIKNSSGGIDWVGMRAKGRALGANLVQGHLLDCDQGCDDMLDHGLAELEDARADMAKIKQPVTWVLGLHDYWVNPSRVEDLLGVPAPGGREFVRVPTGHFLRSSSDAFEVFRILSRRTATHLLGRQVDATLPPTWLIERVLEQERVRRPVDVFDARTWWTQYLRGNQNNPLGFDVLALTDEYDGMMQDQMELLALEPEDRVADIGCGTGNGLAAIVRTWLRRAPGVQLDAVDFVQPALETARRKVSRAAVEVGLKPPTVQYQVADLSFPADSAHLPYGDGAFDAVLLSLVIPYLEEPGVLLGEVHRILRPGGRLVVSTLRPDVDMSGPLNRLREKVDRGDSALLEGFQARQLRAAIQDYIHAAARLLDFEMDGRFRFVERDDFEGLVRGAGFRVERTLDTFGSPPFGLIVLGRKSDG